MARKTDWKNLGRALFLLLALSHSCAPAKAESVVPGPPAPQPEAASAAALNPPSPQPVRRNYEAIFRNPHLLELEKRLKAIVLATHPNVTIELVGPYLILQERSGKFATHLSDASGSVSGIVPRQFPPGFSEFLLVVGVEEDATFGEPMFTASYQEQPFGATLNDRYNLRTLPRLPGSSSEVPQEHWAYREYDKIFNPINIDNGFSYSFSDRSKFPMTRYEFAVAIARLLENLSPGGYRYEAVAPEPLAPGLRQKYTDALKPLKQEFAPELWALGVPIEGTQLPSAIPDSLIRQPRCEFLSLKFSYGQGMDAALREKIQRTIADYAAKALKASDLN